MTALPAAFLTAIAAIVLSVSSVFAQAPVPTPTPLPADHRPIDFTVNSKWIGAGVSYGPYRDGQSPDGDQPTPDQILEDLRIIEKTWPLIRVYGSAKVSPDILRLIREHKLPIKVMLGAWIGGEVTFGPDGKVAGIVQNELDANRAEVAAAIKLANEYPDIVIAVNIGNETQVWWSAHRVTPEILINYIRQTRKAIKQPVTTADDWSYWIDPRSAEVAREIDFIGFHGYGLWTGYQLEQALPWLKSKYFEAQALHPRHTIAITETGWATQYNPDEELQGRLIKGTPGESQQVKYYDMFTTWARHNKVPYFYFSAFDENWKGGPDPREVEKHWGVYNTDRSPKPVMRQPRMSPPAKNAPSSQTR